MMTKKNKKKLRQIKLIPFTHSHKHIFKTLSNIMNSVYKKNTQTNYLTKKKLNTNTTTK